MLLDCDDGELGFSAAVRDIVGVAERATAWPFKAPWPSGIAARFEDFVWEE